MDLDTVGRSELPIYRTNLESHVNIVVVGMNIQIISDAVRRAEVIPSTPGCDSIHYAPIVDATIRNDDDCAREKYMLIVRDSLSVPTMYHN